MSSATKAICFIIVLILLGGNFYFGIKYFSAQKELNQTKNSLETIQANKKYLDFNKMFIEKILKADKEVNIETRLELETAVRNLDDAEVLAQWKKFINSQNEQEAQMEVKNLLKVLADKIEI